MAAGITPTMENLALRHQLIVLKRNRPKPRFTEPDRLFWVAYSKLIKGWQDFLEVASPRTVLDWNKRRFKRYWTHKSRNRGPGRPCVSQKIQDLIRTMSQTNMGNTPNHRRTQKSRNISQQGDSRSLPYQKKRKSVANMEGISCQ